VGEEFAELDGLPAAWAQPVTAATVSTAAKPIRMAPPKCRPFMSDPLCACDPDLSGPPLADLNRTPVNVRHRCDYLWCHLVGSLPRFCDPARLDAVCAAAHSCHLN
jgi:hypothetical protein